MTFLVNTYFRRAIVFLWRCHICFLLWSNSCFFLIWNYFHGRGFFSWTYYCDIYLVRHLTLVLCSDEDCVRFPWLYLALVSVGCSVVRVQPRVEDVGKLCWGVECLKAPQVSFIVVVGSTSLSLWPGVMYAGTWGASSRQAGSWASEWLSQMPVVAVVQ